MSDAGGKLRCGECVRMWNEKKEADPKTTWRPPCYSNPCSASEVMDESLGAWISMFNLVKSEVFAGQTLTLMDKAEATERDLDVIVMMDNTVAEWREAKNRARAQSG